MSREYALRGKVAVAGAFATEFGRFPDRSSMSLAAEAVIGAVRDAGIDREDVDGLAINIGYPMGVDYDQFSQALGLRTRYNSQLWTHGRWLSQAVEQAAAAIATGCADTVVLVNAQKFSVFGQIGGAEDHESIRADGGPHGELPHYGLTAPGCGAAMSARLYMERYGASEVQLAEVAMSARAAAALNPRAVKREPFGVDEYLASRFIIEPLRVLDFCLVTDGACAIVLTSAEQATDLPQPPVRLLGTQGIQGGPDEVTFGRPFLGVKQQAEGPFVPSNRDLEIYDRAGVGRSDIDAFYTYDAFSPLVWYALERFGYCAEGDAPAFCEQGRTNLHGELPINTNGGLLSEGHCSGWNHLIEMVAQLRGSAGERQLSRADVLQWGTAFGDSLILSREA